MICFSAILVSLITMMTKIPTGLSLVLLGPGPAIYLTNLFIVVKKTVIVALLLDNEMDH